MKPTFSEMAGTLVSLLIAEQKNDWFSAAAVTGTVS